MLPHGAKPWHCVLPTALNCNTFRPRQHSNSSRACRNCCATVTNSNFLIGFCRIPLPLPAQFSLSNSKQQFKFYPRKQTKDCYSLQRTQKEKNIGANDFPAQTDVPQAVKSQHYSETSAGFSQLPGHWDGSAMTLGHPCTSTFTVATCK